MTAFDYAVLTVIAASVLLGLWRGVVSEILALAAWVVAFLVARAQGSQVADWLTGQIAEPGMRLAAAYVLIFVGVLLVFAIARMIISLMLKAVGLGLLDRLLGAAFGVLRGVLVVWVAVLVAGMTPLPKTDWWRDAMLAPPLETAVIAAKPWLPAEAAKRIRFR
ncbi:CvpA family protein [Sulfuritalea hydrogenivorans]|uniref:Colicin V production protein n=1 Tax=Sulfuritalea hydrogenivorans sk43H TaxID=1223802 RepID=W0SD10_9PROT|nr:CvpA family protein [Sulfuritalea hydrogenivorans]BAO29109.1 colicin V production protein [Sulfuritalea hydrogenivorans sk43H]